jgi:hypothetical protein
VVDYHAVLVAADGEQYVPGLTVDGVHPNANGYAVMAPLLEHDSSGSEEMMRVVASILRPARNAL